ncbi:MAG TPA: hypothetical protein VFG76_09415 [Candidatus Polarisedimenticolia bacterium]|nr:hypothetical protein [Candidatus Polarisedimenticolia bacterium]
MKDKETKKLGSEDLAKRVAPLSTPIYTTPTDDPTMSPTTSGGGGSTDTGASQDDVYTVPKKPFPKSNP